MMNKMFTSLHFNFYGMTNKYVASLFIQIVRLDCNTKSSDPAHGPWLLALEDYGNQALYMWLKRPHSENAESMSIPCSTGADEMPCLE
jgi:hypothetical protein